MSEAAKRAYSPVPGQWRCCKCGSMLTERDWLRYCINFTAGPIINRMHTYVRCK